MVTNFVNPLLAGVLHSFEPDHVSAVSVLAAEQAAKGEKTSFSTMFKASKWAFGHSLTLILFGALAIIFQKSLQVFISDLSFWAELSIGPIMVWLGIEAIRRNHEINRKLKEHKKIDEHDHDPGKAFHLHGKSGEEIAMNPMNRSFWVGMIHGLAGTGGILTTTLILSSTSLWQSISILIIESLGIILAMGVYSYSLLVMMTRFLDKHLGVFKLCNAVAGLSSIVFGLYLLIVTLF